MINSALKYCIIIGIAVIHFLPLYVANDLFFPFITGKAFVFRIIVEIIFASWLILILREKGTTVQGTSKSVAPKINSLTILITVFTFFILIADLLGLNPLRSIWSNFERMEGWMTLVHLWAYFLVLSSVLNSRENWNKFFDVVLVSGFITALYGLFQFFGFAETHQGSRVDASLGNAAYMAVYMLINAFLAAYMAFTNRRYKAAIWIYSVLAAFFSFIMFQTATRGTILGWIAAVLVSCLIYALFSNEKGREKSKEKKLNGRMIASGVIALVVLVGVVFYFNRDAEWIQNNAVLGRLASISLSDTKTQARGYIWPMAVKGVFENPKTAIIGIGQENFNYIFNANYNPQMWSHEQWFDRAHSVFLDWLVAGGLIGLGLYLTLYILAFVYVVRSDLSIGQKSVLIGLLVGYGIHNIFVFDNQTSYIMFFTVLAFIHSFKGAKTYKWFGGSTKSPSEDAIVVRDYVFVPIILIVFVCVLYFINIRPIKANNYLIDGLRACSTGENLSTAPFEKALGLDQTVANQEIREQYYSCARGVLNPQYNFPAETVTAFYDFAKKITEDQIEDTPNDARGYIIAGTFYNSIGDWNTAQPLLEKAHELSPDKQSITHELALNYINLLKVPEALVLLENAYLAAPDNPTSKVAYVVGLISAGQDAKAEELFGDEPYIFSDERVVSAYVYTSQFSKVIEIYKQEIQENPMDPNNYSVLATMYLKNKQNDLAIQTLRTAQEKFPELTVQIDRIIADIQAGRTGL